MKQIKVKNGKEPKLKDFLKVLCIPDVDESFRCNIWVNTDFVNTKPTFELNYMQLCYVLVGHKCMRNMKVSRWCLVKKFEENVGWVECICIEIH